MDDSSKDGFQATPASTLEQQIMDACVPKNEREHWAAREITRLRAEVKRLTAAVNAANSQAEHFERQWYLRGDEVEALRADAETKRGLLLWALYRAQGGSSPVGQPIRRHLGIEQHAHLTLDQIQDAARAAQGDKT